MSEIETSSKNKNIRDLYKGIHIQSLDSKGDRRVMKSKQK